MATVRNLRDRVELLQRALICHKMATVRALATLSRLDLGTGRVGSVGRIDTFLALCFLHLLERHW